MMEKNNIIVEKIIIRKMMKKKKLEKIVKILTRGTPFSTLRIWYYIIT